MPNIIRNLKLRQLRWARHIAYMEQSRNMYGVLVRIAKGKKSLKMPICTMKDIKMDLREVSCDARGWIDLAQDRDK